ncbi:UdgX family uracil-DNA binding protein [Sphingosinicella sp. CPCC 101087]|uniref:UdgX family uracil-DNA binding protein n=1 Tax=Sphingosinicella sp. CPCC 101087 TaxID=2497754 RepID=UPI00101B78A5|nr:UdgX family uracil-DNA binding protein [Sphingosinicella sp. CPCC 101087]
MRVVTLAAEDDFEGWRDAVRPLAAARVPPQDIFWRVGEATSGLFDAAVSDPLPPGEPFSVPRAFLTLAETVVCHSDPERFALLYAALLRVLDRPDFLADAADSLVQRLERMARTVRRDIHKMHAFLRFREVATPEGPRYVAWFEPDHHVVRAAAGFFVRRFAGMRWSILTPALSVHWDGEVLAEGPGAARGDAPADDPLEQVWKTYYASIFNPARLNVDAMLKEMPRRYWKNMPETALVGELIKAAPAREAAMIAASTGDGMSRPKSDLTAAERQGLAEADEAERRIQPGGNALAAWESLLADAKRCTRCHLYKHATQTVFGEGPLDARILFVGEQPGDQEDLAGRPFVGPAGQLFDRALGDAGVDREKTYVTNAVKHFKFEPRGKRRIHSKPQAPEIEACRWWIEQERILIRPAVTVALGATAARSIFGKVVTITAMRGRAHKLPDEEGGEAWVTVHPSFLLRVPDADRKREEYARFVDDLARIARRADALR